VKKIMFLGAAVAAMLIASPAFAEMKYKPGEDAKFTWANLDELKKVDLKGETLTIFGPWRGDDEKHVQVVLDYFREATGADVKYSSSENYEQQVVIDTSAGSPANISVLPQPGLIADLAAKGLLSALTDADAKWMAENYGAGQSWVDIGSSKDKDGTKKFFGFSYKTDVKSLVWYSPENFKDAGYKVPTTMEELIALSDQIVKDGGKPWCIGLGSGGA
jgi:alpha-glucoside transport system substrate-binding protein